MAKQPNIVFVLCDNVGWGEVRFVRWDGEHIRRTGRTPMGQREEGAAKPTS